MPGPPRAKVQRIVVQVNRVPRLCSDTQQGYAVEDVASDTRAVPEAPAPTELRLDVDGMTCASCAARVERGLNKLDGVEATVNLMTNQAAVKAPASVTVAELVGAVEAAGYHARPAPGQRGGARGRGVGARPRRAARTGRPAPARRALSHASRRVARDGAASSVRRLGVGRARAFDAGRLLGRRRFPPRRALNAARHRGATMDTLISIGTLAAWLWSAVVLRRRESTPTPTSRSRPSITTLILLGRYLEARAKRRSGEAIRRCSSSARRRRACCATAREVLVPVGRARSRRPVRRPAGREDRDRRRRRRGRVGRRPVAADRRVGAGRGRRPAARSPARRVNTLRAARRPRDAGRRRHGARADRAARRGGAVGQGAGAAARRPRLGGLRARRDRDRAGDARGLARVRRARPRPRSPPRSPC